MTFQWLIYCIFLTTVVRRATSVCPSSCYCDDDGEYLSCVGDGVWEIPSDIPTTTIRLELRNYLIDDLTSENMQDLTDLQELKLQQSHIKNIENSTFLSNHQLQRLDLSQNLLTSLSSTVFHGLEKLRFLDLSSNLLQSIDEAFTELTNLEQLNLRDNHIPQLTTHTFYGLHKVQYLNLDANNISSIEVGTFQYLTNLAHLIISNNPLTSLSRLDFFGSRLQFIDISHVGLTRVPQSLTKFVRDLRLAKNNLTRISAGDFDSYPYLGLLVLDDNCVSEIENDALGRQEYLMRLWLNGNCLTKVPPNLPPSLLALYMEENKLTHLPSYSFKGLIHLEQLFLQRNKIEILETCAFCDLVSLKSLDLQANLIENLTSGVFANLTELVTLDLSQNNLKFIDSKSFDCLGRLSTLQLSRIPTPVQIDEDMFDSLQNLRSLEVYDSALLVHKILNSTRLLHGLRKVQELNIMHNRIVRLRADFPSFFPGLKTIKMSGNLWHCDRSISWLSSWIKQSNVQFYSSYSIRCTSPENLQFKPLMMLTENDFTDSTTWSVTPISHVDIATSTPNNQNDSPSFSSSNGILETLNTSETTSYQTTEGRIQSVTAKHLSDDDVITTESSTEPKFMSADPFRYSIIYSSETPLNITHNLSTNTPLNDKTTINPTEIFTFKTSKLLTTSTQEVPSSSSISDATWSSHASLHFTSSSEEMMTTATASFTSSEPQAEENMLQPSTQISEKRVLSSRLRGWTYAYPTSKPSKWDHTTTIIVSTVLAGGGIAVVVVVVTLFTLFRCRHRYQPVKHRQMRRSSSISYYPQKDEVSIVTLTEGTVGLRTNSHHGLGNKLYYIMESYGNSDPTRDALPDPQLQELLPHTQTENVNLY